MDICISYWFGGGFIFGLFELEGGLVKGGVCGFIVMGFFVGDGDGFL